MRRLLVADYWIWWVLAGGLVVAELVTGTFLLLALGVAFAVGGFVALAGATFEFQLLVAGIVAIAGIFIAHRWRRRNKVPAPEIASDVGQTVRVQAWNPDGSARVAYRGTLWMAEAASPDVPRADTMVIVGRRGSTLLISDRRA
jgi:membrane protein implicated in regulation of membrane protease activity